MKRETGPSSAEWLTRTELENDELGNHKLGPRRSIPMAAGLIVHRGNQA